MTGREVAVGGQNITGYRSLKKERRQTMQVDTREINSIIQKHGAKRQALVPLLQEIQSLLNWLPEQALETVAEKLQIPLRDVYGVATFYRSFSLVPRGKHTITVCVGTACHVRGGPRIVYALSQELNIKPNETTPDMYFTLETVNCLGCCAIGPVVVVDGEYHGEMTAQKTLSIIRNIKKGDKNDST